MLGIAPTQLVEALPGILVQEAQRHIVGRAAPALHADSSSGVVRARYGATTCAGPLVRTRVASSDWWASRNVVSVTRTADEARSQRRETLRPELDEQLRGPGRRRSLEIDVGQLVVRVHRRRS